MKFLILANSVEQANTHFQSGPFVSKNDKVHLTTGREDFVSQLHDSSYDIICLYYPLRWTDNLAAVHRILEETSHIPLLIIGRADQEAVLVPILTQERCHFVDEERLHSSPEVFREVLEAPAGTSEREEERLRNQSGNNRGFQLPDAGYRVLFEQAEEAIFILRDGIFVECNQKTEDLFKAPREKLLGRSPFELSPAKQPDGRRSEEKAAELITAARQGTPQHFHWQHKRPDGSVFDAEVSLKAVACDTGNVLQAIVRDITTRKKTEQRIRDLSRFPEENPSPIIRVSIQGQIVYANRHGKEALEQLGIGSDENLPPELMRKIEEVVQGGSVTPLEYKIGGRYYSFIFSEHPQRGYVTLYGFDITETKHSQQALEEAKRRYQTFVQTSFEGIFSVEMERPLDIHLSPPEIITWVRKYGYIGEANDASAAMVGLDGAESFIGIRLAEILDQGENNSQGVMEQFIRKQFRLSEGELVWTGFDGITRILQINITGVFDQNRFYRAWGTLRDVTEKRRNEEALRESEAKFRALTESASSITFIYQRDKIQYLNSTAEKLIGWTRDEVIGRKVWEFVAPEYREMVKERVGARQRGEERPAQYELILRTMAGDDIWVEVYLTPIELHGERAILGTAFDITERKHSEDIQAAIFQISEATHTSQTMDEVYASIHKIIRKLMPAKNFFIALYDEENGEITFPYFVDEFTSDPSPRKADNGITEYVIHSGKPLLLDHETLEKFRKRKEIEPRGHTPVDWLGVPLRTEEKTIGILAVQSYDTGVRYTEKEKNILNFVSMQVAMTIARKQTESELAKERQQLTVTLHSIGDGVLTTDTTGRIVLVNRAAENLIGRSERELQGECLSGVLSSGAQETAEYFDETIRRVVESKQIRMLPPQTVLKFREESRRIIAHSIAPLLDEQDEVFGTVLVFRDETEKHNMEMELLKSRKLESVGTLAGGIAHDFNNILAGILGYVSLARLSLSDPGKVESLIHRTERAVQRASNLTNQLLTFSKGGAPVKETASIAEVIKESVQFALHGSNVSCTLDIPEDLWLVDMDQGQIDQVLQNVIINADQSMPSGGTIRVDVENLVLEEQNKKLPLTVGKYVRIKVSDEGNGIPNEHIDKIFDPYFTTKEMGNGLGLATAYSIIDKHKGYIKADSRVGQGTTISIYLPATGRQVPVQRTGEPAVSSMEGRILVMDDEETVLDVASEMLRSLGYRVETARDGDEALKKYKSAAQSGEPYDFAIIDLTVPGGKGGVETVRSLHRFDSGAQVIVSSGYSNDPVMAQYEEHGFGAKVSKPYNLEKLKKAIRQLYRQEKQYGAKSES